ncbi:MAG: transporter substrate-binding domain-containing protein [Candidatus Sabulitectum sp.]|nr:transporter substrate-binding domain-containing protein [Candidatus Sabulitectum sp.]
MGMPALSTLGESRKTLALMGAICVSFLVLIWLFIPSISSQADESFLTPEERAWLDENPDKLTLFYNPDFPPIEFADENGDFTGLGADVIVAVEERLGIQFVKQSCNDWSMHLQALKEGQCAVAPTIVRTDERESYSFFTVPYARVPVVIITTGSQTGSYTLDSLVGLRVAVVSGYATEDYVRESADGSLAVFPMWNVLEALHAVAFGEMDAFVGNMAVAAYYANQEGLSNLRVAGITEHFFEWSIGVSREYPLLFSAVQKALDNISDEQLNSFHDKWISMQSNQKLSPRLLQSLRIGTLFVATLLVSLFIISLYLKKRLNEKISSLENAQETLIEQANRLQHSEKMEALGTLSGGVAHDFNNILQVIEGYAQLLLKRNLQSDINLEELEHIVAASRRAAALITKLMAFSRNIELEKVATDINGEVTTAVDILKHTIPRMVEIKLNLEENLMPVLADPVHLEQIIFNLANNAADAMPDGGELTISTFKIILDNHILPEAGEEISGSFVAFSIEDTGCGMSKELQTKMFNPFFTTKEQGKGTGLGLASVYGMVKSLQGAINCTSLEGVGTTFQILLPAASAEELPLPHAQALEPRPSEGGETILVVDDEPLICQQSKEFLELLGYVVYTAETGEEALEVFSGLEKVDLVLLDLNMPGMGGYRCLQELLRLNPSTKVLILSGHSEFDVNRDKLTEKAMGFVRKPYRLNELALKMRESLSSSSSRDEAIG